MPKMQEAASVESEIWMNPDGTKCLPTQKMIPKGDL
jgi:hypothetical protein